MHDAYDDKLQVGFGNDSGSSAKGVASMKRIGMCAGLVFALSCGVAQNALAQEALDVTMRVLDDVKDVDAVILEIGEAKAAQDGERREGEHRISEPRNAPFGDEHLADPNGHDELDEGENDHGDGKYEDHAVPSDELDLLGQG
jgi:hypothetical protein